VLVALTSAVAFAFRHRPDLDRDITVTAVVFFRYTWYFY
jgi:hypothetical protein